VGQKRLELLHEMVPTASTVALLINPADSTAAGAKGSFSDSASRSDAISVGGRLRRFNWLLGLDGVIVSTGEFEPPTSSRTGWSNVWPCESCDFTNE
jgi:hypothetical protein